MNESLNCFIYALKCPETNYIRYIGKSTDPYSRTFGHKICGIWQTHIEDAEDLTNKSYKSNWIRKLLNKNLKPILEILDEVPKDNWQLWEKWWIATEKDKITALNLPKLTNATDGGEGKCGNIVSNETKDKIRKTLQNNHPIYKSAERNKKISDSQKERWKNLDEQKRLDIKKNISEKTSESIKKWWKNRKEIQKISENNKIKEK